MLCITEYYGRRLLTDLLKAIKAAILAPRQMVARDMEFKNLAVPSSYKKLCKCLVPMSLIGSWLSLESQTKYFIG